MAAGGFTAIGLIAALIVRTKEHEEIVAEEQAMEADTVIDGAAAAAVQMPLAMLGGRPCRTNFDFESGAGPGAQPPAGPDARCNGCLVLVNIQ
jgi:hypothetical protein